VDLDQLKAMLVEKTTVARAKPAKKAAKKAAAKKTAVKAASKPAVARRKPAVSKADKS
jgi:hypothetical protein